MDDAIDVLLEILTDDLRCQEINDTEGGGGTPTPGTALVTRSTAPPTPPESAAVLQALEAQTKTLEALAAAVMLLSV